MPMVEYPYPTTVGCIRVSNFYNTVNVRLSCKVHLWHLELFFRYKLDFAIIITIASIQMNCAKPATHNTYTKSVSCATSRFYNISSEDDKQATCK